jgi:acetyl-CoA acyltransferase
VTVNRFCASGLTALAMAADRIRVGEADVMIAAGTESMSMVPMMGNKPSINPRVFERDENVGIAYGMGLTAEKVAQQWKVSREAQDAFALESHRRRSPRSRPASSPTRSRRSRSSRSSRTSPAANSTCARARSRSTKGPRADTTLEALAKLRPVFAAKGSVTAGNSSQTSDGAGALIVVSERR